MSDDLVKKLEQYKKIDPDFKKAVEVLVESEATFGGGDIEVEIVTKPDNSGLKP